eukprot:TRINITY_DN6112_c0_g1_i2.p1 TRINITY_DN6112_c0_g1~~TRINITY_DN6112_c0_g1_i2.p1  ORF type:complete len:765 (+),score=148.67 TRINITY_DN6112_c0_g1_i2:216-2510(+)
MMYGDAIPAGFGDPNLSRMEDPLLETNHINHNSSRVSSNKDNNKRTSAASIYASAAKSNAPVSFDSGVPSSGNGGKSGQPSSLSASMPLTREGLKEAASSLSSGSSNMSASLNLNPELPVPLHLQNASSSSTSANQPQQTGHFGTVAIPPMRGSSLTSQKPIRPYFKVPDYGQFRLQREMLLTKSLSTPAYTRPASRPFIPWKILGCVIKKPLSNTNTNSSKDVSKDKSEKGDGEKDEKEEDVLYFVVNTDAGLYCDRYALRQPYHRFESPTPPNGKPPSKLVRFNGSTVATCQDLNLMTLTNSKVELCVGFNTGQILVHDPFFKSITVQINFTMAVANTKVTSVKWIPGSKTQFIASHTNGTIYIYDKTRTDERIPPFVDERSNFTILRQKKLEENSNVGINFNPVVIWKVCKSPIHDMAFSSDGMFLAAASQDGLLRVLDFSSEIVLFAFRSYFGALLCVTWSPDDKYLIAGGEDDLITVWSFKERKTICRGEGHKSWVSSIVFDKYWVKSATPPPSPSSRSISPPDRPAQKSRTYRFGSVGQDGHILMWEFKADALPRPRSASFGSLQRKHNSSFPSPSKIPTTSQMPQITAKFIEIPAPSRLEVSIIEPLVAHRAHNEPISSLFFTETCIISVCSGSSLKFWARPSCYVEEPPESLEFKSSLRIVDHTKRDEDSMGFTHVEGDHKRQNIPGGSNWTLDQQRQLPSLQGHQPQRGGAADRSSSSSSSSTSSASRPGTGDPTGDQFFQNVMGKMRSVVGFGS